MKWEGGRESDNVEDRRDDSDSGGGGGMGRGIAGGGIGVVLIAVVAMFLGVDPSMVARICPWATELVSLDGTPCWAAEDVVALLGGAG